LPQHPFPRRESGLCAAPLVFSCSALFRTLCMRYISAPYSDSDPPAMQACTPVDRDFMHAGSAHKIPNIEPTPERVRVALVQRNLSRRAQRAT
jgi:hypothetical protein